MSLTSPFALRALAVSLGALLGLAVVAAPGTAHSQLTGSEPQAGATVDSPTEVILTFNEELLQLGTTLTVTDATGFTSELEPRYPEPHVAAADLAPLPPGATTVTWRVVSADGHPIEGVLVFEVLAPTLEVTEAASPSPTPLASPTPTATASASITPSATPINVPMPEQSGGVPWWLWTALAAAIASATGIAVWSARKR